MRRPKTYTANDVALMLREFGIDLRQRLAHVRTPQQHAAEFVKIKNDAKAQFRRLAFEHHPDRNGGDDTEFKRINEIWQLLEQLNPAPPKQQRPAGVAVSGGATVTIVVNGWGTSTTGSSTTGSGWW